MKNKRLPARVMAVFAAVLLITALSVPTFAATSYEIIVEEYELGSFCLRYPGIFPEGTYNLTTQLYEDDQQLDLGHVTVSYEYSDGFFISQFECSIEEDGQKFPVTFVASYLDIKSSSLYTNFAFSFDGASLLPYCIILESLNNDPIPSLTDYITAETLPNVLNEVISLLPIALGVLVGYIAIRKGIAYLQSFLHNS